MPVLDRRLLKLEALQPPPSPMSREENEKAINELLAKAGSSLAKELERHGSILAIIRFLERDMEERSRN